MASFTTNNFVSQVRSKAAEAGSFIRNNPLCGISLQRGAKCIVIAQMAIFGIATLTMVFLLFYFGIHYDPELIEVRKIQPGPPGHTPPPGFEKNRLIVLFSVVFIFTAPLFVLHAYLYKGIKEGNYIIVNRCWNVLAVLAIIEVILMIVTFVKKAGLGLDSAEGGMDFLNWLCLYVVYFYKEELNRGADLGGSGDFQRIV